MADTFICIYCKLTKPSDQRSKEHLLQRSLGGDLTAQFVCKACNGTSKKSFSVIVFPLTAAATTRSISIRSSSESCRNTPTASA